VLPAGPLFRSLKLRTSAFLERSKRYAFCEGRRKWRARLLQHLVRTAFSST
jgi:hypothetical protein